MIKLTHLRDVIAVAERGSLRAAARQLGIAQPAITRSIRELENILGTVLFERHTRGVITTPIGQTFIRRAMMVQNELRLAQEEVDQLRGLASGRVSAVLSSATNLALLPRALERFRQRYPNIVLHIAEGLMADCETMLGDGSYDFYVGPMDRRHGPHQFLAEKLFDNRNVILCRKGHALSGARSLAELTGAKWLSTQPHSSGDPELTKLFADHALPLPAVDMQGGSALTTIIGAASTDLLLMVPEQWLMLPNIGTMFDRIDIAEPLPGLPIYTLRRAHLPLTPAAEYLCDMLRWASQVYVAARAHGQKRSLFSNKPILDLVHASA